ncbi:threonine/serine exporter family protein [Xylanimonas oleitrophica]|uniref:Threonine/serine exporter family protein n=1 Tax=Xylanimonas oleitrophica TaxID=2607479 RepID=A0A2W5XQD0_9MICO|nr:threonine/serine exporter family protein [Xylanimonas oleitrophica]PZR51728.1 threonine/serine exporter family protein [Xylanimonas oleitrophica]
MTTQDPGAGAAGEADLEPVELIRQSGTVHRAGRLALSAGHGSYRVKSHMERVGRALGLDEVKAHVALTEITTTSVRGPIFRTEVSEVRTVGINADRLAELERYIGDLPPRARLDEVSSGLDRIAAKPPLYPAWANALSAGVACAAFAFLNHGGAVECAAVLVAASLGQLLRRSLIHRGVNQFGVTMLAAAVASLAYLGLVLLVGDLLDLPGQHVAGYVSAVLFLVPGFPLVTGALDLARLDFSAGISRITYAVMILFSAALSLWAVSAVVGLQPEALEPAALDPVTTWSLLTLASFFGVLGFALMFNSPWYMALGAASIGMVANVLRLVMVDVWAVAPQAAAAGAALVVGLLARAFAGRLRVPRLTISVPAVVIMVPGVTAYRAVYEFNAGSTAEALGYAVDAGLVVVALAIGLAVSRMLTDRSWGLER